MAAGSKRMRLKVKGLNDLIVSFNKTTSESYTDMRFKYKIGSPPKKRIHVSIIEKLPNMGQLSPKFRKGTSELPTRALNSLLGATKQGVLLV
jgi:hypothetical protein